MAVILEAVAKGVLALAPWVMQQQTVFQGILNKL